MLPPSTVPIPGEITEMLARVSAGNDEAWRDLIPLVYSDLHRLARSYMRNHASACVLQPTALVNETYLRLLRQKSSEWKNRGHFFGIASILMRRILVDEARRRGVAVRVEEQMAPEQPTTAPTIDLLLLDWALIRLGKLDARQARVVEMRYFGGLTIEETAECLDLSVRTVKRDWEMARTWLHAELRGREA